MTLKRLEPSGAGAPSWSLPSTVLHTSGSAPPTREDLLGLIATLFGSKHPDWEDLASGEGLNAAEDIGRAPEVEEGGPDVSAGPLQVAH